MTERALAGLLGGPLKVKLIKMFLFNPGLVWSLKAAALWVKATPAITRREISHLQEAGLVIRRGPGRYAFNKRFLLANELRALLHFDLARRERDLVKRFRSVGRVRLLVVAGMFLNLTDSRADLLLVGTALKRKIINRVIRSMELELGRELVYAVMDPKDFDYRYHTRDRFVRDLLDYPHQVLVDKVGLSRGPAVL